MVLIVADAKAPRRPLDQRLGFVTAWRFYHFLLGTPSLGDGRRESRALRL